MSLLHWQTEFLRDYPAVAGQKTLLVTPVQAGRTVTAARAVRSMMDGRQSDLVLILSASRSLHAQWVAIARDAGMDIESSVHSYQGSEKQGFCESRQAFRSEGVWNYVRRLGRGYRLFFIRDDDPQERSNVDALIDESLNANRAHRALFLSSSRLPHARFDTQFEVDSELKLSRSIVDLPSQSPLIDRSSVLEAIRRLADGISRFEELSWRQFERVVALLFEDDGYRILEMKGTNDGGVDISAIRQLDRTQQLRLVVQVKRWNRKYKVRVHVVRELVGSMLLHGADKGVIVTSSYLSRGALALVGNPKIALEKVDRDDLRHWIRRTAHRRADWRPH